MRLLCFSAEKYHGSIMEVSLTALLANASTISVL